MRVSVSKFRAASASAHAMCRMTSASRLRETIVRFRERGTFDLPVAVYSPKETNDDAEEPPTRRAA